MLPSVMPEMDGPAVYRICAQGTLDAEWSKRLGGMNISTNPGPSGATQTILVGRIADQTALSGVLNGQFVKRDDKATGVMSGLTIRYPVEEKSRFVPATTEQWMGDFSLGVDASSTAPR